MVAERDVHVPSRLRAHNRRVVSAIMSTPSNEDFARAVKALAQMTPKALAQMNPNVTNAMLSQLTSAAAAARASSAAAAASSNPSTSLNASLPQYSVPPPVQPNASKYSQLLALIEELGKDIRPTYTGK